MKLPIIAALLMVSAIMFAGTPPDAVSRAFKQKFTSATNIKWGKESNQEWEANFKNNGINGSANFSIAGDWLETETEIPISKLPETVISAINQAHEGCKIVGASIIERVNSDILYEADIRTGLKTMEALYKSNGTAAN
jgi:hypothetical protein